MQSYSFNRTIAQTGRALQATYAKQVLPVKDIAA